jgi:hypothetical protein
MLGRCNTPVISLSRCAENQKAKGKSVQEAKFVKLSIVLFNFPLLVKGVNGWFAGTLFETMAQMNKRLPAPIEQIKN